MNPPISDTHLRNPRGGGRLGSEAEIEGGSSTLASGFAVEGFQKFDDLLDEVECDDLIAKTSGLSPGAAGSRGLLAFDWCRDLGRRIRMLSVARAVIPPGHVAMECTYFKKCADRNWLVSIHQDRSIPVAVRVESQALRGWSQKQGVVFVQPPLEVLNEIVAIRVHLDDIGERDGALEIVPGSHLYGHVSDEDAVRLRNEHSTVRFISRRGAAFAMRPLLLHQSSKSKGTSLRRILDFRFGPGDLPYGLAWNQTA